MQGGLYDSLITEALAIECLAAVESGLTVTRGKAPDERLPELVGRLVGSWVERELRSFKSEQRAEAALRLTAIVATGLEKSFIHSDALAEPVKLISSVVEPGLASIAPPLPLTPLSDTALLTNAPGEASIGKQITREIESSDSVDILMAFVRTSGINLHMRELQRLVDRGGRLRILTTTYTGSTQREALDKLAALGDNVEIKVSYNTQSTRLHAKSWLFHRNSGFSTGMVGSSNLTHQAQVTGMEWNVRVSSVTTPGVLDRLGATFDSYWHRDEFEPYDPAVFADRVERSSTVDGRVDISHFDVRPYAFQQRILDQIEIERTEHGHWKNLVVAATGTGKTVMAALDYQRLQRQLDSSRLLFVAHRREILDQSRGTFRGVLRNGSFGERWLAGEKPAEWKHVFASIQTINRADLSELDPEHFDVVIVDEFHHAAAESYRGLLDHLQPKVLLGLTATPERADGLDIKHWFGGRFAAELRLWDALDDGLLAPFHYYGVHDDVDLASVSWKAGKYVTAELSNLYTGNTIRAGKVVQALDGIVDNPHTMRALGFCVTVEHAEFMAAQLSKAGLPSVAVSGNSSGPERDRAMQQLASGEIRCIFSVDVFNEGVDIPSVDTVLLLRPTESATIYLQQLGRGLRKSAEKDRLTVLDFIGQHRQEFRFDQRLRKLLKGSRTDVIKQVEDDFPFLPAGCHMELDRVSKEVVLSSLKSSLPTRWPDRVRELRALATATGSAPTLAEFVEATGLELGDVYTGGRGWTALRRACDLIPGEPGADEEHLQRAVGRLLHVDDAERLEMWRALLQAESPPNVDELDERGKRLVYMLHASVWGSAAGSIADGFERFWANPAICAELVELFDVLRERIAHLSSGLELGDDAANPLRVHGRYSRDEILAGFGLGWPTGVPAFREGVKWVKEANTDLFLVTLNKDESLYSPTTLYKDYAISPELFHWESQSMTSVGSPTGQRYLSQRETGTNVLLFVRERNSESGRTMPYLCLGAADYVQHTGDRPIAITYKLRRSMPADLFLEAKAVAG